MSNIEFTTFTKPAPQAKAFESNEFTDTIKALIEATDGWIAQGNKIGDPNQPAFTVAVDLEEKAESTVANAVQVAARHLHKTARRVARDDSGVTVDGKDESGEDILSGIVRLTYIVKPQEKSRRKRAEAASEAAPPSPEAELAEAEVEA